MGDPSGAVTVSATWTDRARRAVVSGPTWCVAGCRL